MAKGKWVYHRAKKTEPCMGQPWPEKKKLECLTAYIATGSLPIVAAMHNIPYETLRAWKKSQWWKEQMQELQYEDNITISSKLSKIMDKTLAAVEDRIENGEYYLDNKTGKIIRVPPKLRDIYRVTSDIVEKKQALLKLQIKEEQHTTPQQMTADHLVQLAQAFAAMATGKQPSPNSLANEIIEGECHQTLDELGYETKKETTECPSLNQMEQETTNEN